LASLLPRRKFLRNHRHCRRRRLAVLIFYCPRMSDYTDKNSEFKVSRNAVPGPGNLFPFFCRQLTKQKLCSIVIIPNRIRRFIKTNRLWRLSSAEWPDLCTCWFDWQAAMQRVSSGRCTVPSRPWSCSSRSWSLRSSSLSVDDVTDAATSSKCVSALCCL